MERVELIPGANYHPPQNGGRGYYEVSEEVLFNFLENYMGIEILDREHVDLIMLKRELDERKRIIEVVKKKQGQPNLTLDELFDKEKIS